MFGLSRKRVMRFIKAVTRPRAAIRSKATPATSIAAPLPGRVVPVPSFGTNPGALRMLVYVPQHLPPGRPMVVVLHGCSQDATSFAAASGWIAVAIRYRLSLVMPEQNQDNNPARCFNWFRPEDIRRGAGETMSIRQMIRTATRLFGVNPKQIFVVGFSAGGGMAASLLAAYPALFAAGGVVAGMPVGCATTPIAAMMHMRRADTRRSRQALAGDVRTAAGPAARRTWPRLSIWQGEQDRTVAPENADALAAQWSELHGFGALPTHDQTTLNLRQRQWGKPGRRPAVELCTIADLGHGFPVDPKSQDGGHTGAWVTDAGVSAAQRITMFWGLT